MHLLSHRSVLSCGRYCMLDICPDCGSDSFSVPSSHCIANSESVTEPYGSTDTRSHSYTNTDAYASTDTDAYNCTNSNTDFRSKLV